MHISKFKQSNDTNSTFLPKLKYSERNENSEIEQNNNSEDKDQSLLINTLWDELGVTDDYRHQFNYILESNIYNKKIILYQEKENLQKFRTSLMKLKKEIFYRENNIQNLVKIIKNFEEEEKGPNKNILKEVINTIKNLRLNAINIVIYINRVRELGFYYYFQGKWDLTKVKNEYMYNNNYLLQMKYDLNFLKNSWLNKYIEFGNNNIDPFFFYFSQININKNNKIIIPISDDLIKLVEQSLYFVIQDQIMDNIYKKKSLTVNNTNTLKNKNMNRSNSMKIKIKKLPSRPKTSKNIFSNTKIRDLIGYKNNFNINSKNEIIKLKDIEKKLFNFKSDYFSDYNNLIHLNQNSQLFESNNKITPESTRINNRIRNKEDIFGFDSKTYNDSAQKKIKIEHEILNSLNSSNLNKKYLNESTEKIMIENEKLKKDNEIIKNELLKLNKKMEENEKFKKKLEEKINLQKKEMVNNSISVEEIKVQLIKEKKELEQKLKNEIEKNIKFKKSENEQNIINKEIQLQIKDNNKNNNKIYNKKNIINENFSKNNKIFYYKENLNTLIYQLKSENILDKIESKFKLIFDLETKLYNINNYIEGQYPKIIIYKNDNKINGICSYYYNNINNDLIIIIINFICIVKENSYEQINDIIKFIKKNEVYDKIEIGLSYYDNKDILIKYFENNLGFNFENKNKLIYSNNKSIKNNNINNKGYIYLENIFLLSFIKNNENNSNKIENNNYKYINYPMISNILYNYDNKNKFNSDFSLLLKDIKNIEELKSKIKDNNIINKIKNSLCFNNSNIELFDIFKFHFNIFFKNILYLNYNNYYYNRISSEEIEIIKDIKNSINIYNIPTLNDNINILIIQLNSSIKNIIINNNNNIYEAFLEYYKNLKDKYKINKLINIYIPFLKIEKNFKVKKFDEKIKNNDNNLNIGTLDEYINIDFSKNEKININEQINYLINNEEIINNKDIVINNEFIFGIINNKNKNISLIQLIYVKKDDWIIYN